MDYEGSTGYVKYKVDELLEACAEAHDDGFLEELNYYTGRLKRFREDLLRAYVAESWQHVDVILEDMNEELGIYE